LHVVGKQNQTCRDLSKSTTELMRWLPNDKAIEMYHDIKRLKGEIVFLQFVLNDNQVSQEPPPLEFIIDKVYISILDVHGIPLPQAFINGRPIDKMFISDSTEFYRDVPVEINIADLYRLSTINPFLTAKKSSAFRVFPNQAFLKS